MNRQKRVRTALAALALGLVAAGNAAAEEGWYFSLSGGASIVDIGEQEDYDLFFDADMANLVGSFGSSVVQRDSSSLDDSDKFWGVHAGYRFGPHVAAEVGYLNLGRGTYEANVTVTGLTQSAVSDARYTSRGVTAALVGLFPIGDRLDVHARVGIYFADTRLRLRSSADGLDTTPDPLTGATDDDIRSRQFRSDSQDLMAGAGATWNINDRFSVRAEYQRLFDVGDSDDELGEANVDLVGIAILFR